MSSPPASTMHDAVGRAVSWGLGSPAPPTGGSPGSWCCWAPSAEPRGSSGECARSTAFRCLPGTAGCEWSARRSSGAATEQGCRSMWTINDPDEMNRLLDMGVDGLVTDNVEALAEVMRARGHWPQSAVSASEA
ncbi:hypothetical protein [Nesterenkonia pannonica]|uniref:glycerophosphodiester phosphodiesterase family protein n=1 Tax=Nesterenkonia pannonica TaxID=1548602 RepID=UPI0021641672|nr:glycerophosphodiester phosphodiesterase family protein [Nesterenkonia pannonica]